VQVPSCAEGVEVSRRTAYHQREFIVGVDDGPGDEPATLLLHVDKLGEFTPRRLVRPVAHDQLVRLTAAVNQVATLQSAPPSELLLTTTGAERARNWKLLHRSHLLCHEGSIHRVAQRIIVRSTRPRHQSDDRYSSGYRDGGCVSCERQCTARPRATVRRPARPRSAGSLRRLSPQHRQRRTGRCDRTGPRGDRQRSPRLHHAAPSAVPVG